MLLIKNIDKKNKESVNVNYRKIMMPLENYNKTILNEPFIFSNKQANQQKRMRWFNKNGT